MKQITTIGIVLSRTNFGEADRILGFLTPDYGKLSAIAKGVRKSGSKLAGSIEFFSISELSFVAGRGEIYTITSARLSRHFYNVVSDLQRSNAGYDFIRTLVKATEDNAEPAYFDLLQNGLSALDDTAADPAVTSLWFKAQLVKLAGHSPNLQTDANGQKLQASKKYNFDIEGMYFYESGQGTYAANHIKFLRLCFSDSRPQVLQRIESAKKLAAEVSPQILEITRTFVRA